MSVTSDLRLESLKLAVEVATKSMNPWSIREITACATYFSTYIRTGEAK